MSDEAKSCSIPSNAEPTATTTVIPMWIVVATLVLLFLGFVFFDKHSGWFDARVYAPYRSADELEAAQPKSAAAAAMAAGKKNYETYCGSCHGNDGMGKAGMAPPLTGSEIVLTKSSHRLSMIPLEGLAGPIKVKNQDWNLNMAAMGAQLSDDNLGAVLTYIRGSWGNHADEVTGDDIKAIRAEIGGHPTQLSGEKFMAMPE